MPDDVRERTAPPTLRLRRAPRALRRVALALLAVAVGIAVAFSAYQLSVQPGAAIVKAAFETGSEVTPPADFAGADKAVTQELGISIGVATGPDATVDIFTPSAPATTLRPIILWVHGGGFISSSSATVRDYAVMLANAGYTVASLDYTLAPGAHHPTPVVQANAALAFLHEHAGEYGGDPTRIVIGGDSAGAQIAGETAAVQTNPALASALDLEPALTHAELRAVVLFCGLYDMRTVGSTGFPALRTYLWAYTGVREYTHYADIDLLSVAAHVTSDFPPTFLTVGDADPFATQADELDAALELQAVPTTTLFWTDTGAGLGHEYQFDFALPEAGQAFAATLAFLTASTEETP